VLMGFLSALLYRVGLPARVSGNGAGRRS
jgi:hypothetical protein